MPKKEEKEEISQNNFTAHSSLKFGLWKLRTKYKKYFLFFLFYIGV